MEYFISGWLGILGAIIFGSIVLGMICSDDDGSGCFATISFIIAGLCIFYLNTVNWDMKIIKEYEKASSELYKARIFVETEQYSEMKSTIYLNEYIQDSITWYNRINESVKNNCSNNKTSEKCK